MEEWRAVVGYEGLYEVSDTGRVRALPRTIIRKNGRPIHFPAKEMSERMARGGYIQVKLSKNGKCSTHFVHRLVADAFISNPCELPQVNHKNEVKTDNRAVNLEWCDNAYNHNYGTINERISASRARIGDSRMIVHAEKDGVKIYRTAKAASDDTGASLYHIYNSCYSEDPEWNFLDTVIYRAVSAWT